MTTVPQPSVLLDDGMTVEEFAQLKSVLGTIAARMGRPVPSGSV